MARYFSSSAGYISVPPVVDSAMVNDIYRYQTLHSTTILKMKQFIDLYTEGSFHELEKVFTETELRTIMDTNREKYFFNEDISNLVGFKYDPTLFVKYQKTMYSILTGFQKSVEDHRQLESATTELIKNKALLTSKDDLIEYIKKELGDTMVMKSFMVSQTYNINTVLKPWYSKYFELYGAPSGGIFNVEKMAFVVDLLIENNVITMEEFIQNK